MDTPNLGIPAIVRSSDGQLIPSASIAPNLIERLAASHAAVLEKWARNFALDLRQPQVTPVPSCSLRGGPDFVRTHAGQKKSPDARGA